MLFNWLGTSEIEVECDAPLYAIVRACRKLGFRTPEDVRWCRARDVPAKARKRKGWFDLTGIRSLFARSEPGAVQCSCGQDLPILEPCAFTLNSGEVRRLQIGQCRRCHTMHWQES